MLHISYNSYMGRNPFGDWPWRFIIKSTTLQGGGDIPQYDGYGGGGEW